MVKKNKGIIKVRELKSYKIICGTDYLTGLCKGFRSDHIDELWDEYWNSINAENKMFITEYFSLKEEMGFDKIYLLRLFVLNDFCNQYGYELRY